MGQVKYSENDFDILFRENIPRGSLSIKTNKVTGSIFLEIYVSGRLVYIQKSHWKDVFHPKEGAIIKILTKFYAKKNEKEQIT